MPETLQVAAQIQKARPLPASYYRSQSQFDQCREKVFAQSWQCIGLASDLPSTGAVQPFSLMQDLLGESLLLTTDEQGKSHCFANICPHRGSLLALEGGPATQLQCPYHASCFGLDGQRIEGPAETNLHSLPLHKLGNLLFTAIKPKQPFAQWTQAFHQASFSLDTLQHMPDFSLSMDWEAHWVLCLNHFLSIPAGLNTAQFQAFEQSCLQRFGDGAHQIFLFPNLILRFYPWGMMLGLIEPISLRQSRIRFETFVGVEAHFSPTMLDALLSREQNAQAQVEAVQIGIQSRLYQPSPFDPETEAAVHYFHQLLAGVSV